MKRLIILILFSAGCSVKKGGELTAPSSMPTPSTSYSAVTEINNGAQAPITTSGNYKVAHSINNKTDEVNVQSSGGYKVYLSVQGTLFSEGP